VVAVRPDGTPAAEDAVDRAGDPDGEAAETARQGVAVLGLDQKMQVVVLDAYSTLRTAPRCALSATVGIP